MEISRNSKRREMEDKIFNLPSDVLNCILDHLPVRDAARTSILSREWRYIWANHPNLVLEPKNMFGDLANFTSRDFIDIVDGILFQHIGPILTFKVNLPDLPDVDFTQVPYVDRWILYLSRNGLRKLTLDNSSYFLYVLPSHIFLCQGLTHLVLSKCIFKPPCGTTRSFHSLKNLSLNLVVINPKVSASIFSASRLEYLNLTECIGIDHLNFDGCVESLLHLVLKKNNEVKLSCFMNCKSITRAYLAKKGESFDPNERIDFTCLFEHWSQISKLTLNGQQLKFLAADSVTSALPVEVNNLRDLRLFGINFTDLDQISCILCLLHSSPRLNNLVILVKVPWTADKDPALQYLQEHIRISEHINSLQTLKIKYFEGSRSQMLFVKLILACCPSLERITFVHNRVEAWNLSNILKELLLFPRVSKAQIVF
ncbi:PREDICTED: F-box/FBD/LRR-repeat protein At1g13570-like [Ipomoea nil]|uniref:F-box/FBD/LRR-repeat protein At1g13570-like n=1 Tax=Ipomoea nil TaxID=35883 RepID=UPI00090177D3|nr:PREDICTED: F-box/FBD/LRR-repeat protein At1g13570-like [Ipomoea nil]